MTLTRYGAAGTLSSNLTLVRGVAGAPPATFSTTAVSPSTIPRWPAAQTITITGAAFNVACTAYFGATALATTFISSTSVTAVIPEALLYEVGAFNVTVQNPGPVASNAQTFTVTQPSWLHLELRPDMGRTMNGIYVQVLADQSGKGDANRNASQLTAGVQPQLYTAYGLYNGKDALFYNNAWWLRTGIWTASLAQPYRTYWVGDSAGTPTAYLWDGAAATNRNALSGGWSGAMDYWAGGGTSMTIPATLLTAKCVAVTEANGAATKFAKNAKTFSVTGTTGTLPCDGITLGAAYNGTYRVTGIIARYLIVDSTGMTAAQHGRIMDYLGAHYGITIAA